MSLTLRVLAPDQNVFDGSADEVILPSTTGQLGILTGHISMLTAITGCTTLDPYTREEKTSSATKGAAIGAATGVAVGTRVSHRYTYTRTAGAQALYPAKHKSQFQYDFGVHFLTLSGTALVC